MFLLHSISDPSMMMAVLQMNGHVMKSTNPTTVQETEKAPMFLYWLRNTKWISKTQHIELDKIVDNVMQRNNLVVSGVDVVSNDPVSGTSLTFNYVANVIDGDDITRNWKDEFFAEQYEIFHLYCEDILRIQDVSALHQTILDVAKTKYGYYHRRTDDSAPNNETNRIIAEILINRTFILDGYTATIKPTNIEVGNEILIQ